MRNLIFKRTELFSLSSIVTRVVLSALLLCTTILSAAQTTSNNYFHIISGTPHIPVLSSAPVNAQAGAIYINSVSNALCYCNGSQWFAVSLLGQTAPDGTPVVEITSPTTGRIWMDRNLGTTQAATSSTDYKAYGSLFQWCRAADGHQQITWTNATTGSPLNGTTNTLATSPTNIGTLFITNTTFPYDWINPQLSNEALWWNGSSAGANNPCPTGYHIPTYTEWEAEKITDASYAFSQLKLTMAGYRDRINGDLSSFGSGGWYWSSSITSTTSTTAQRISFNSSGTNWADAARTNGFSVRCIKD